MEIIKYNGDNPVEKAIETNHPLIAVISFDGKRAYVSHIDEAFEHYILLRKVGYTGNEIDEYFRIIVDKTEGASWTCICPPDYKNIPDRTKRITTFYEDGFSAISKFLAKIGYLVDITIPRRYRRHIDAIKDDE
ncbi:MAG: hypothetical protein FWG70_01845 [Oscillospiraceae bacterium]|nr:hypothetical protein [Oscillospiraceae bacterium]